MFLEIIFFFISTQLIFFSIIGYGNLFLTKKNSLNLFFFISFILGLIFLNIIGCIFYYLSIKEQIINLGIFIIGIMIFIKKNDLSKINLKNYIFYNLIFFSGIILSKLHEDWPYHFSYIDQVARFDPIIGIGNIDTIHILSTSFLSYFQKLLFLPYFDFKMIMIPIYLIYLNFLIFLINELRSQKNLIKFIFLLITSILIIKINRIAEFGYDYTYNFLLLSIIAIFLKNNFSPNKYIVSSRILYLIIFVYCVSIKVTALFFLPILISIYVFEKQIFKFDSSKILYFLTGLLIFTFVLDNFLRSGCIFYFLEKTCFTNYFSWTVDYYRIEDHALQVKLWAKGFYVQNLQQNPSVYLSNFNWISTWINKHFFYKIFEFIIFPIFFLTFYLFFSKRSKMVKINKSCFYIFLGATISVIFWLFQIPQLRFASSILIFFFCTIILIMNFKINIKSNLISQILIVLVLIYNIKNFNRISNEFQRNDALNFIDFPFPPNKKIQLEDRQIKFSLYKNKKINDHRWFKIISNN